MQIGGRRGGWSLVDLMIALTIVGILSGIAIPAIRTGRSKARAAQVQGHLDQLKVRMMQVCASTSACADPQNTTVFSSARNGVTPEWLRDSLTAEQQFDQRSTRGYLLEWVPVSGATTTAQRRLSNCQRCHLIFTWFCSGVSIFERTTTVASYGQIAVVDVQDPKSDLGNQLASQLNVTVQAQPTGTFPNRWIFDMEPLAFKTIQRDTNPTRTASFGMTCS